MRYARNNNAVEIGEDVVERCAGFRWKVVQLRENCARLNIRRNRSFPYILAIIGDPIRDLMQLLAEFVRRRVAKRLSILHQKAKPKLKWNAPKSSLSGCLDGVTRPFAPCRSRRSGLKP